MYNFINFKSKLKNIEDWLKNELGQVRTGRATPSILDRIFVESYGSKVPVNQIASIAIEDAKSIRIIPWDKSQSKSIEKAIVAENLGVSVSVDEKGVRVFFPELTTESKTLLLKVAKEKTEQAKISVRTERDRVWTDIQQKEKEGEVGEDDKFRLKNEMQKIVDESNKNFESSFSKKEKEIMG